MRCTVKKTLEAALESGNHALVQVKDNQPELLGACETLVAQVPATAHHIERDKGHGRIEQRTTRVFQPPPGWLPESWAGLITTVLCVQRVTQRKAPGKTWIATQETAFYVCTRALSAPQAAGAIRGHWKIENSLHYVRDVTLREDHCRVRHNPGVLARVRTLALNILQHNRVPNVSQALFINAICFNHLISLKGL